jgi:hypothetical protein
MSTPSLREIEEVMTALWTDPKSREELYAERRTGLRPAGMLAGAPKDLLDQIDMDGVELYADLMRYGMQELMLSIYPGCAALIGESWEQVVDDYLKKLPPSHYHLNNTAQRFREYITEYGGKILEKYPFLPELADYEWIELELMEKDVVIKEYPYKGLSSPDDLQNLRPVVNPALVVRTYQYPVTEIVDHLADECSCSLPEKIQPRRTTVVILRDPVSHKCTFMELAEISAAVVETAQKEMVSYRDLAASAVKLTPEADPQDAVLEFLELVEKLQTKRAFVGSAPVS